MSQPELWSTGPSWRAASLVLPESKACRCRCKGTTASCVQLYLERCNHMRLTDHIQPPAVCNNRTVIQACQNVAAGEGREASRACQFWATRWNSCSRAELLDQQRLRHLQNLGRSFRGTCRHVRRLGLPLKYKTALWVTQKGRLAKDMIRHWGRPGSPWFDLIWFDMIWVDFLIWFWILFDLIWRARLRIESI